MQKHLSKAGFTILELSVVLTVVALIAGTALAVGASRVQAAKIEDTQTKMEAILETLDSFVKNYGYIPCPADPLAAIDGDEFGLGKVSGGGNCIASNLISSNTVKIGVVPTVTLGLAPSVMMDGWNRRITYVMDEQLAGNTGYNTINPDNTAGWMTILSTKNPLTTVTDKAVVVLISHGQNGHGAWKAKGGAPLNKSLTDNDENENTNLGNPDNVFVQKFLTDTFDDIVYYRLKWQFPAYNP